jgi:zinc/manganese transport system ATP-binding protein
LHLKEKPGSMAALFFKLGSLAHAESSPQTARAAAPQSGPMCQRADATGLGLRCPGAVVGHYSLGPDMSTSGAPILRFDNLTLGYNRHPAVHHLKGEVVSGSLLAVVGPNGAGKSTLLKGIVGEIQPMQGHIELIGLERRNIAYLTQQSAIDGSFPIVIHDFVAMGLWAEFGAFRGFSRMAKQRIEGAINAVGLSGLEDRPIGQLSGGQLQRARFARVILQDSPLVLLDEPYGAIDANTVRDMAALVRRWNSEGRTVISVLHDFEHVRQVYPETLLLAHEVVARGATAEVLSDANLLRARQLADPQGEVPQAAVCRAEDKLLTEESRS